MGEDTDRLLANMFGQIGCVNGFFKFAEVFGRDRVEDVVVFFTLDGAAHVQAFLELFRALIKVLTQQQEFLELGIKVVPGAKTGFLAVVL